MNKNLWEISDDNGKLYNGTQEEIRLIWDLLFKTALDLSNEYLQKYSYNEMIRMKRKYHNVEWSGELKLIEIHEKHTKKVQSRYRE